MINKNFIGNRIKFMNTISRKDGLFVLCASELIDDQPYVNQERCDSKRYGIVPLNKTPGFNYITNSQDLFPIKDIKKVEVYDILYQEDGVGAIAFLKFNDLELQEKILNYEVAGVCKTFFGLLKLMMEWRVVKNPPFNNDEQIATIAQKLLISMQIPQVILSEIWNTHPDMHVFRFLKGQSSARNPEYSDIKISYDFHRWTKDVFLPDDYIEINGEIVSPNDPRIAHVEIGEEANSDFYNQLLQP